MRLVSMAAAGRIAILCALGMLLGTSPLWATPQRPLRVAVVGAGVAGLTAAHELTALGHEVVVFEKENRVGGKVFSVPVGDIALEFGAVLVTQDDYPITLGYAERFGISSIPAPAGFTLLEESGSRIALQDFLQARYSATEIALAGKNYAAVLDRFAAFIDAPGMVSVPHELSLPFAEFAERHGIGLVYDWMKALLTGFGYGYSETVPAAYYIKFLPFLVRLGPSGLEADSGRIFPGGFQSVLDALAATLDVRLDSEVTHIERPRSGCRSCQVRITVNGIGQHWFDAVVIATPLDIVPRFLDVTPFEAWLFTRMQSVRYVVTLFAALGVEEEILYFRENADPGRINHVGALAAPYDFGSVALGNAYQVVERERSALEIETVLKDDLRSAGGRYLLGLGQKEWPNYFLHVGPRALELGFYDVIDRMQGDRGTYFVGSSLTFETVEHAARQAKSVILAHFGG